jgi:hypothetical protein
LWGKEFSTTEQAFQKRDKNSPVEGLSITALSLEVSGDGGDPDGVKAHILDIIEMVLNAFEGATAVNTVLGVALGTRFIGHGESIGHKLLSFMSFPWWRKTWRMGAYLVNGATLPVIGGSGKSGNCEKS